MAAPGTLLLLSAAPASANSGMFWVAQLTPQFVGWAYVALIAVAESLALWRIGGVTLMRAVVWCALANLFSGVFGAVITFMPVILLPSYVVWLPFWPLLGNLDDPVNRTIAVCLAFFLVSAVIEYGVYTMAVRRALPKERQRTARATLVGNAVSNGVALVILLVTPGPYQATAAWQWQVNNRSAALHALKAYQAEHGGRLPPETGALSVNEALLPYLQREARAILRHGKVVNYDRPRWRRDWPELRMTLVKNPYVGRDGRWEVAAPDADHAWARWR